MSRLTKGERDQLLELFIRFVDEGKTPPRYLLEFMADGAKRYREADNTVGKNAKREPWPIDSGAPAAHQKQERRHMAAMIYALKQSGVKRERLAEILGKRDRGTLRLEMEMGKAIKDSLYGWGGEYRIHLADAFDHPGLLTREREMIRIKIKEYDDEMAELNREPSHGVGEQ